MSPEEAGLKAVIRLVRIECTRARLRAAIAEREVASLRIGMAEMELEIALWASETGEGGFGLNGPSLRRWLRRDHEE